MSVCPKRSFLLNDPSFPLALHLRGHTRSVGSAQRVRSDVRKQPSRTPRCWLRNLSCGRWYGFDNDILNMYHSP